MKAAAVQFKARKGQAQAGLEALRVLTAAASFESDLVVLPEMAVSGYVFEDAESVRAVAESARGPTFQALAPIARTHGTWLVCGFPERAADRLFNSAMVIDPAGELAFVYRKTLLFEADTSWATPGDSGYRRFDTDRGSFGVGICMDLNDDRFVAWCAASDLDAVALPTNWLDEGMDTWSYWAWRISGQRGALIAANTYGAEAHIRFSGRSALLQGRRILAAAPPTGDCWIGAPLSRGSGA